MTITWNENDHTRATAGDSKPGSFTAHTPTGQEISDLGSADAVSPWFTEISFRRATYTQKSRIEKDLASVVTRHGDDRTRTLRDVVAGGLSGKTAIVSNGKLGHLICAKPDAETGARTFYAVSKALWDAVDAPDERPAVQQITMEIQMLEYRLTKLRATEPADNKGSYNAAVDRLEQSIRSARGRQNMLIGFDRADAARAAE